MERLTEKTALIIGCGGLGGYVIEELARVGVGKLILVDGDVFSRSNMNRQLMAKEETLGKNKAEVMRERILSINPEAKVFVHDCFFLPEKHFDYLSKTAFQQLHKYCVLR